MSAEQKILQLAAGSGTRSQAQRLGAFRGRNPKSLFVPPKQGLCPKESNRSCATGVHFVACAPQNTACAHLKRE